MRGIKPLLGIELLSTLISLGLGASIHVTALIDIGFGVFTVAYFRGKYSKNNIPSVYCVDPLENKSHSDN